MQCIARRDERFKAMAAEFLAPSPPAKALEELPCSRSTRAAATSGGGGSLKADGWQGALAELLAGVPGFSRRCPRGRGSRAGVLGLSSSTRMTWGRKGRIDICRVDIVYVCVTHTHHRCAVAGEGGKPK